MPPLPLITAQTEEKLLAFLTEHGHTKFRTQQVLGVAQARHHL